MRPAPVDTLRVGVSTVGGRADDPAVWSGTPAGIVAAMRRSASFAPTVLAPPAPRTHLFGRGLSYLTKRLPGSRKLNWEIEPTLVRAMTQSLQRDPASASADVLLALGWMPLRNATSSPPLAIWNDSTYAQRVDASPHWSGLGTRSRRLLERTEASALAGADAVVFASRWSADDAVARYSLDPARVHVVALGANVAEPAEQQRARPRERIRLLTIGVEWHRKGIDVAVRCADELRARGHDVSLDVVGVSPPDASWRRPFVTYHGFISKRDATGAATLDGLYRGADVFLFPTRDEPYGVVLAEAAAYSLPAVAPARNAIPEIVADGVTGVLVPPADEPSRYADAVERLVGRSDYEAIARNARAAFRERLNWDRSVERLAVVLGGLVG